MSSKIILNAGLAPAHPPEDNIAAQLRRDMGSLKGEFYDLERGQVDYAAMRDSEAYRTYVADSAGLQDFDPHGLEQREERLAFWINLYNTLVIHGVIELGIRESVKEQPRFFNRIAYRIGGEIYTPDAIEHGILRGNRRPPYRFLRPFSQQDNRRSLVIDPPDPRIHFTLVCASSSCPPINFYSAEKIADQLDIAAAGFINGPEVEISPASGKICLSPIFRWYRVDFNGHEGIINFLIRYLDQGKRRDFLITRGLSATMEWKDYDWRLNR